MSSAISSSKSSVVATRTAGELALSPERDMATGESTGAGELVFKADRATADDDADEETLGAEEPEFDEARESKEDDDDDAVDDRSDASANSCCSIDGAAASRGP